MITLSVVVPVRDGERFISDALASLGPQTPGATSSSSWWTTARWTTPPAIVAESEVPGLSLARNPTPVGLADARNTG
ncbi:hypothetical protein [Nonomuraea dietziae]|uniref:glycosyltransferase family 2 protein n=1 Tax=Nonomuraea dietziae TaxID=65515 RepID=UPI0031DE9F5F